MWKRIAYLLATVVYISPAFFHSASNVIDFEAAVPKQDKFFHEFLQLVQNGEEDQALALYDPSARAEEKPVLEKILASVKDVGAFQDSHLLRISKTLNHSMELIYYLDYENGFGVADFKIHRGEQGFVVDQFVVRPMHESFDQSTEFPSLLDIDIFKLFFMLVGYLLLLLNAKILVECCYSPLKPKWAWILFILVGFGAISFYLEPSAGMNFEFLSVHVPIAELAKNPLWDPWRVTLTLPLGMLVFLYRNREGMNPAG